MLLLMNGHDIPSMLPNAETLAAITPKITTYKTLLGIVRHTDDIFIGHTKEEMDKFDKLCREIIKFIDEYEEFFYDTI